MLTYIRKTSDENQSFFYLKRCVKKKAPPERDLKGVF